MDSILTSIKKTLGIAEEYTQFDMDIIMHINSVLAILTQIGVGSAEGFEIADKNDKWTDFVPDNSAYSKKLNTIKTYVYMKVRLLFDPPMSSSAIESMNKLISEFEWRISVTVDPSTESEEVTNVGV